MGRVYKHDYMIGGSAASGSAWTLQHPFVLHRNQQVKQFLIVACCTVLGSEPGSISTAGFSEVMSAWNSHASHAMESGINYSHYSHCIKLLWKKLHRARTSQPTKFQRTGNFSAYKKTTWENHHSFPYFLMVLWPLAVFINVKKQLKTSNNQTKPTFFPYSQYSC